eukprot:Phypoly_transcript_02433.p1 GENE.Phypoly_transcript_02433~~Phypoly_transcript_02433.p1  ORF type:complete len:897 (+),score=153.68 Phypoly_transcript_02433:115-2805(+)
MKVTIALGVFLLCLLSSVYGAFPGYQLASLTKTDYGYQGNLTLIGAGPYGSDIQNPAVEVTFQSDTTLRIKIYDPSNARWEVPNVNILQPPTAPPAQPLYNITFTESPFGFAVIRVSNGDVIFNTTSSQFNPIVFEDQYLELSTVVPQEPNIYGLGERVAPFRLPLNTSYTMWAKDIATPPIVNLYGTHPFYLEMRNTSLAHGVFALNSNAQDWIVEPGYLTYRTIGGIFDIFVFLGPDPATVVQQYQAVVGLPYFPPYWSLGWHQCKYGYESLAVTEAVVGNYSLYGIPLDTMWNDIDYMDGFKDFTTDPVHYPIDQLRAFTEKLHQNGQHYIPITDPGIGINNSYSAYTDLLDSGAYVRIYNTTDPLTGRVWPGSVIFPDFLNPAINEYWYNQYAKFWANGPIFDGSWIDMNEPSNFCSGQCAPTTNGRKRAISDNPPYVPGNLQLDTNTVNVTAETYLSYMYNTHNLYGWSEGIATKLALEKLRGTRAVVISRSTFAGSGRHNGHWLGDNHSSYEYLANSISGILSMQLFGIPFVGADICGFNENTTMELCARWMQLGSLYPFARNHNVMGAISQEPYAFGQPLINISIAALNTRYTLLPYFYTLFALAHTNGTTVWRPLFFEFPTDTATYGIDEQFLIGEHLLVSPVLKENATSVAAYFPEGQWYDYYSGQAQVGAAAVVTLAAPLEFIPIHVRGGAIIPTQGAALTTTVSRTKPYGLLVGLDAAGNAHGDFYVDDGESLDPIANFSYVSFQVSSGALTGKVHIGNYNPTPLLGGVTVYGVQSEPKSVTVNQASVLFTYTEDTKVLKIQTAVQIVSNFVVSWNGTAPSSTTASSTTSAPTTSPTTSPTSSPTTSSPTSSSSSRSSTSGAPQLPIFGLSIFGILSCWVLVALF